MIPAALASLNLRVAPVLVGDGSPNLTGDLLTGSEGSLYFDTTDSSLWGPSDGTGVWPSLGTFGGGGGGGGVAPWLNITNPTLTTFSWRNQGAGTVAANAADIFLSSPANGSISLIGREIAASAAPFSVSAGLIPMMYGSNYARCGIYISDGTKLVIVSLQYNAAFNAFQVDWWGDVNASSNGSIFGSNLNFPPGPCFLKAFDDGTDLNIYVSPNGKNWMPVCSFGRTFYLSSVAFFGFFILPFNSTYPIAVDLVSWATGTS